MCALVFLSLSLMFVPIFPKHLRKAQLLIWILVLLMSDGRDFIAGRASEMEGTIPLHGDFAWLPVDLSSGTALPDLQELHISIADRFDWRCSELPKLYWAALKVAAAG